MLLLVEAPPMLLQLMLMPVVQSLESTVMVPPQVGRVMVPVVMVGEIEVQID